MNTLETWCNALKMDEKTSLTKYDLLITCAKLFSIYLRAYLFN